MPGGTESGELIAELQARTLQSHERRNHVPEIHTRSVPRGPKDEPLKPGPCCLGLWKVEAVRFIRRPPPTDRSLHWLRLLSGKSALR